MKRNEVEKIAEGGQLRGQPIHPEITETHISWVLFSESYALKIKKPEKLSFLDFSTLEKRKYFCQQEFELNSRLASIYLQVLPIIQRDETHYYIPQAETTSEIDSELKEGDQKQEVVDYGVLMRKQPAEFKMDKLLSQNKVGRDDILNIAHMLADFHRSAEVVKPKLDIEHMMENFNDIGKSSEWVKKKLGSEWSDIINKSIEYNNRFLQSHQSRLQERIEEAFIRDVHGDLHSKNIFIQEEPVIFDCIEFNEEFRQIDLLDELAFFCMDLEAHSRSDLSDYFIEVYRQKLEVFTQKEDRAIFDYYRCYRANVRAKVMAIKASQQDAVENERNTLIEDIKLYLKLMEGYQTEIRSAL